MSSSPWLAYGKEFALGRLMPGPCLARETEELALMQNHALVRDL